MNLVIERGSRAYLDFVAGIKASTRTPLVDRQRARYEQRAPEFAVRHGRAPVSPDDVRSLVGAEADWAWYGVLSRRSQQMMWHGIGDVVAANERLVAETLTVDLPGVDLEPELPMPAYYRQVEFHLRPGGMWDGDHQGLLTDLASGIYRRGGERLVAQRWVAEQLPVPLSWSGNATAPAGTYPGLQLLDLGCGIGKATWPLAERFPGAALHGLDLSAPLLRYLGVQATERGVPIALRQGNAERTPYATGSFDLVLAYILFHELPDAAAANVVTEMARLLRPGGVCALADIRPYTRMEPFQAFVSDWQTEGNEEPYWREHCQRDLAGWLHAAGFSRVDERLSPTQKNSMLYLAVKD